MDGARTGNLPGIIESIGEAADRFTAAERRVADAVAEDPKVVAFGTVAALAERSGTSGPTVLRFAARLGFAGFADLQVAVRNEIADQLRPAAERIRQRRSGDLIAGVLAADVDNVRRTLEQIDPDDFASALGLVADRRRQVFVIAGELSGAPGRVLAQQLDLLRADVRLLEGSPPRVSLALAEVTPGDVVFVFDLSRYERWVLDAAARAAQRGGEVIVVSDAGRAGLGDHARLAFAVAARGAGPFDSLTGSMAFVHALVAATAARLRRSATQRLDRFEAAWAERGDLAPQ